VPSAPVNERWYLSGRLSRGGVSGWQCGTFKTGSLGGRAGGRLVSPGIPLSQSALAPVIEWLDLSSWFCESLIVPIIEVVSFLFTDHPSLRHAGFCLQPGFCATWPKPCFQFIGCRVEDRFGTEPHSRLSHHYGGLSCALDVGRELSRLHLLWVKLKPTA
jgi:hypothetical protein